MKPCRTCGKPIHANSTICIPCQVVASFVGYHYNGSRYVKDRPKKGRVA